MRAKILIVDDCVDQCMSLVGLLRPYCRDVTCAVGCRTIPRVEDQLLAALDLDRKPVDIYLPGIGGVILDGSVIGCRGANLVRTFLHHGCLVVGASGDGEETKAMLEEGAPMALHKPTTAEALLGNLAPTECYPWRGDFSEERHRPILIRFDCIFRPNGCAPFGQG